MSNIFEVLADSTRRQLLDLLRTGERSVGELVELLTVSQPGVSKHLKVLREAGLVQIRQEGKRRVYQLVPLPLQELEAWLAPYRRLWAERLDALEAFLAKERDQHGERDRT